ncbi:glutamate-5-semialdehyde dehydrogenase [Candidatus Peregrinibacteria bacterium CG22_combo_CG10-13_8_21_14_all_44_10]|nr:MAG: glutamate-5-semialdehyde dehydrogenase [Candidatus Peregrinibacteria bacterium CG2_30_44_17]PIP65792.1 MAG: glutamate-5-semialdehyde dehydrogenase [Candidatus Peregrinibacteria bacterium CG22_combo_CG10-13_8_21_14_all_44_10]PIS03682.1 MAG: glutamate-5-semialdehyde dehydrogenase [Candidatus Peregrinibacteria bacterium CG10_big_fil_rev_8_21_14_0_10_44_7]PIX80143.1 MAG: glutamate-5-semialdehyde dehydrogenase [Candidatus Peregrinibacteria bacterium CG_4_10_14_3_um_filter_44_21]PJB88773.1 MA
MELIEILQNAAQAAQKLKNEPLSKRDDFLLVLKAQLEGNVDIIIEGNKKDIEGLGAENPMRDRLKLDENRILAMAASLEDIRVMSDPLGLVLEDRNVESGLHLKKVTVPLGVVGVIYESRPNVTIDVAALCVKSGNVAVLRGGSDAHETNKVLYDLINKALYEAGLDVDCVTLLDTDRELVKQLLNADEYVDVVIPRGGQSLIDMVRENSRVPVIETGAGVVHIYVDSEVDIDRAASVVVNAKTDRPAVCNALDTLIIHADIMQQFLANVLPQLEKFEVKIYADDASFEFVSGKYNQELVQLATDESFGMEYLSMQMALRIVSNLDEAIDHITRYSSKHSESILTDNKAHASEFLERVDAAVVYVNTSTRFTDGGVFGLGAEIGISTQKLHARGPMGVRELTTYKWQVESDYAVR